MFDFKKDFFKDQFEKYPELLAFLSSNVDATADYYLGPMTAWMDELYAAAAEYLPDAQALELPLPIQELLEYATADKRSLELERTMLSLMSAYSIASGNYLFFALSPVVSGEKVSQDQLKHLSELYNYAEYKPVVDLELVIGDLGKIRPLRQYIRAEEGIEVEDPDQFITALLQKGQAVCAKYLPSIANLSPEVFSELAKINTGFQFGHFAHAESTERELAKLKQVIDEHGADYLSLNMLVQCLDVVGAAAHNGGKLLLNQAMTESYLDFLLPILMLLKDHTPEEVYEIYLKERLDQCGLLTDPLAPLAEDMRLLARLLCMFRITEPGPAVELHQAYIHLEETSEFRNSIEIFVGYEADSALPAPTDMSALLVALKGSEKIEELARKEGKTTQEIALNIGLKLISACLKEHRELIQVGNTSPNMPVSFNVLTRLLKEDASALDAFIEPVPNSGILNQAVIQLKDLSEFRNRLEIIKLYQADPKLETSTCLSALLVALKESPTVEGLARKQGKLPQEVALSIGLRVISCCLKEHYALLQAGRVTPEAPVSFNELTRLVKEDASALDFLVAPRLNSQRAGCTPFRIFRNDMASVLQGMYEHREELFKFLDDTRKHSLDVVLALYKVRIDKALSAEECLENLKNLQKMCGLPVCGSSLVSTVVTLNLEQCINYCKQYMLNAIETAIMDRAEGPGFDLGIGGSRHRIDLRDGRSSPVPERVSLIMQVIKNNDFTLDEKLEYIRVLKMSAVEDHCSSTFFFFGRTQGSTNVFLRNLECG